MTPTAEAKASSNIILISDLLKSRKSKEKELAYYSEKLKNLESKMDYIRAEINLTNKIMQMIRKEEVEDIKNL